MERILQPSDSWEKTAGVAITEEKINEAFYDDSVYKVSPDIEKKEDDSDNVNEVSDGKLTEDEKMTVL